MRAADPTGSQGCQKWTVLDSNQRRPVPTDLQSVPFVRLGNRPGSSEFVTRSRSGSLFYPIPIANVQPEPMMGIEPITYHLQGDCSTVELHRQNNKLLTNKSIKPARLYQSPYPNARLFYAESIHLNCDL